MFPGAPPAIRVALRHRKGTILGAGILLLVVFTYQQQTTPLQAPQDITLVYPDAASYPEYFKNTTTPPPALLPPSVQQKSPQLPSDVPSKAVIIARTSAEDMSWISEPLDPSDPRSPPLADTWSMQLYTTDSLSSYHLHTPINKGREAMAYLTYLIDYYDALPDVILFLHAHRSSWHDNLFGLDAVGVLRRVSTSWIKRRGYVNLRCDWDPGCPDHIHPTDTTPDTSKPEQAVFAAAWKELFPLREVPVVLSQACCAQFAVSRETVRRRARAEYVLLRDWLMGTELEDLVSGRVMEYLYQYIWTENPVYCPDEQDCYCEAYDICFATRQEYREFMDHVGRWNELNGQVYDFTNDASHGFDGASISTLVDRLENGETLDQAVAKEQATRDMTKPQGEQQDGHKMNWEELVRMVDVSRELRTLGTWLAGKQDEVVNKRTREAAG